MNILKNRRLLLVLSLFFLISSLWARGKAEEPRASEQAVDTEAVSSSQNDVAATVNGKPILMKVFERELMRASVQYMMQGIEIEGENLDLLKRQILDDLIDQELVYQAGTAKGMKADESLVTVKFQEIRGNFPDDESYQSALSEEGLTEEELLNDIRRVLVIQSFVENEFSSEITISEQEKRDFYESNPDYFAQPEQVRASHILIEVAEDASQGEQDAALAEIKALRERIVNGEDFADVALEASDCPSSAEGGDLGYFGRGEMITEFEDAAFALNPGEMSDIVKTSYGYHIILVTEKTPEGMIPYEDMAEQIAEYQIGRAHV